ncbi:MAG TPA: DUF1223 domain-containing protein [Casimicrobiaceae bacterium]|nr:DUF1223 domain-containing protein [Casimicrobiaceae bacterium]
MRELSLLVASAAFAMAAPVTAADACRAASGPLVSPLVELYTSEGCDSCPPAESWLSARFDKPGANSAIALEFHVDYWDGPTWRDRFATTQYTARQYESMRANGATFVYTPQVLLQGHDFGQWRGGDALAIDKAARTKAGATIAIDATPGERDLEVHARARIDDRSAAKDAHLFVAYADNGLVSNVTGGENRGRKLVHDHVVRVLRDAGPAGGDGNIDATFTLARPAERGMRPALVAFVERESNGDVLQTLALPLDDCATPR